jgi:hypothetical protein
MIRQAWKQIASLPAKFLGAVRKFRSGFQGKSWEASAQHTIQQDCDRFTELRSFDETAKGEIYSYVKRALGSQIEFRRGEESIRQALSRVCFILGVVAVLAAPFVATLWLRPTTEDLDDLIFAYLFLTLIMFLFAYWPFAVLASLRVNNRLRYLWISLVFSGYVGAMVAILNTSGTRERSIDEVVFVAAVLAVVVVSSAIFLYDFAKAWSSIAIEKAWSLKRPQAAVVADLVFVLWVLEEVTISENADQQGADQQDANLTAIFVTGLLWGRLSRAINAVEQGLPKILNPYDPSDRAVQDSTARIAAGLRELRAATLLPGGSARKEDIRQVQHALKAWAVGGVSDLPQADPEPEPEPEMDASRLQRFDRSNVLGRVALAFAPLILLLVIQLLPLGLADLEKALAPFAFAWLISTGLSILHPGEAQADLANAERVASVLRRSDG